MVQRSVILKKKKVVSERWCKENRFQINRIHHGCPVEIGKSQPEGPPVPVGNSASLVSHWNGGPEGWDFPFSTGHP